MVQMMLDGWQKKHGSMPDIAPLPMQNEPATAQIQQVGGKG
jgi:hypothetical protein